MKNKYILVVDDEVDICEQLSGLLNDKGFESKYATSSDQALKTFNSTQPSLVLLDIWLNNSKLDGFNTLEKFLSINNSIPIIMISGHGNIETAVNSIKKGAYDFIEKPFDSELLIFKIEKALENYKLKEKISELTRKDSESNFVCNSKSSKNLSNVIKKVSKTESSVLLTGMPGEGKEFLSKIIHDSSNRSKKNFKTINCIEKNTEQLEIDFFGKEINQKIEVPGILDEVNGGTILIKNFHLISKKIQGKLLRILMEKKYHRIGSIISKQIDLRIIANTHLNLSEIKASKMIRDDLLKKLNFSNILIPSLSERRDDICDLVNIFLDEIIKKKNLNYKNFSTDALDFFSSQNCIDNVSQLKRLIEWCLSMLGKNESKTITKKMIHDIMINFLGEGKKNSNFNQDDFLNFKIKDAREHFEKKYLIYNLSKYNFNISKMSNHIGMERTALYRKLKSMKIEVEIKE